VSSVTESRGIQYSAEAAGVRGSIRCHVIRRQFAHDGRARYSIVVCNETDTEASALAFVPEQAEIPPFTVVQTIIAPRSDFSTTVVLPLRADSSMPELRIALIGGDTQVTLEVPALATDPSLAQSTAGRSHDITPVAAPALRRLPPVLVSSVSGPPQHAIAVGVGTGRSETRRPFMLILLVLCAMAGAAGVAFGRPQITEVDVPAHAAPGAPIAVSYRVSGFGTAAYAVVAPDGSPLAGGSLALGSGSFAFNVPPTVGNLAYLIRVDVASPLGAAVSERYVHVTAPVAAAVERPRIKAVVARVPAPPQIHSLALDRATVASGETLTVYYDVAAASGSIALLDPAAQITYGRADLSPSGHTAFVAPHVDGSRLLLVVASVQRGKATAQSRIGVTVTPPETAAVSAATDPLLGAGDGGAPPSSTVISAPTTVHANAPIRVDIHGAADTLDVVLLDGTGRELARRELPAGKTSVEFTAPQVRIPTRYLFEATYPHGVGTETVVRAIAILP